MANDPVLRMLGLARRAGKLAYGDELVREVCFAHKARCVFLAGDAGASTAKKVRSTPRRRMFLRAAASR
ncbi:MAG: hypothetical protein ACLR4Z_13635 [Butyricicoccaceae bacterium]